MGNRTAYNREFQRRKYLDSAAREARREYNRTYAMKRYAAKRARMIEYLGGHCVVCGADENLDIDHIDPKQKSFGVSSMYSLPWHKIEAELKKCQLMCEDHHSVKTVKALRNWMTSVGPQGQHPKAKLIDDAVRRIRLNAEGWSDVRWGKELNVSTVTVLRVRKRERYKQVV